MKNDKKRRIEDRERIMNVPTNLLKLISGNVEYSEFF